ncbi:F-box protein skip23 [Rhynchospora pubera]|uniref:F-box protein skip23 n=1 Tax=Rhynchospora pubera TaxID=906938 RepID=A0AAV8F7Z1_9POAL|nr:F-box protein skip23 [Rhynchospora pubera]
MARLCNMNDLISIWIDEALKLVNSLALCWRRKAHRSDQEVSIRIWSELPNDMLQLVIRAIDSPKDYLNFTGVCKSWRISREIMFNPRCNFPPINPLPKKYPFPMLLQPHGQESEVFYFYSIFQRKVHMVHVPELSNKWIPGSWRGWLATIDINDGNLIHFLNPITKAHITLPPLSTCPKSINLTKRRCPLDVEKIVVVSSSEVDTQPNHMIVVLITDVGKLHFCRLGDDRWKKAYPSISNIQDVIEFKGLLHAVDVRGTLFVIETGTCTKMTPVAVHRGRWPDRQYLVESAGDLLLISRFQEVEDDKDARTLLFKLYRLVESQITYYKPYYCDEDRQVHYSEDPIFKIWEEIESLHDQILFVGRNRTLCLDSKLYHEYKGNCIYFADESPADAWRATGEYADPHDNGVYYMNDKRIEYFMEGLSDWLPIMPAIWFSPNPW